jgi:hypothetical protein
LKRLTVLQLTFLVWGIGEVAQDGVREFSSRKKAAALAIARKLGVPVMRMRNAEMYEALMRRPEKALLSLLKKGGRTEKAERKLDEKRRRLLESGGIVKALKLLRDAGGSNVIREAGGSNIDSLAPRDIGGLKILGGAITAGEKKVLEARIKKLPPGAVVLLDFLAGLPEGKQIKNLLSSASSVTTIVDKEPNGEETQRVLVENAGLCLFAPYLCSFFTNLGYVRDNQFKNARSVYKAIHLLQYIATGKRKAPEYLLSLNRLLCGLPQQAVIPATVRLTKKELAEADNLVQAMIANWGALKSTSVDGLRGSFLCRKGIITDKGVRRVLQVERKEYDLLLNGLPWGYSLIKLPWMDKHLEVEW